MKLYVDDQRPAPTGWTLARTPMEALGHLATGGVTHLSLDHDFTNSGQTGLTLLENLHRHGWLGLQSLRVHSGNVEGAKAMKAFIQAHAPAHLHRPGPSPYTAASRRLAKVHATKHY